MRLSSDFEDLFRVFNARRIKYLVVGAHAVMYYTEPRFTKDMDIWVPPDLNDEDRVFQALREFGAPLTGVAPRDFADHGTIFQIGVPPVRIDIMMRIAGVDPVAAWKNRTASRYGRVRINVLGLRHLVRAKRESGRPQDKLDLTRLRMARSGGLSSR